MIKQIKKSKLLLLVALYFYANALFAQGDLAEYLRSGVSDAEKLVEGYTAPFMNAFGNGMSNGWYNTAKAHKTLGFDLTFTLNSAFVPDSEKFYSVKSLRLESIKTAPGQSDLVPTMFGPTTIPKYVSVKNNVTSNTFDGPAGADVANTIGLRAVPVPMAQLGIGIVKNTDLKIRFTPKIKIGNDGGKFQLWGIGILHDIKQHIPGIKEAPFDLAAFVGYNRMDLSLSVINTKQSDRVVNDDGRLEFEATSLTIQGLISKEFSVITFYGGVGFNIVKSNIGFKGTFDIKDEAGILENTLNDPINLNFSSSGPRITAGFRLKTSIFTLHTDYTLQKYNTLTVGFGFSIREQKSTPEL